METVHFGKPSLVLPFHTEQEANGRRLEQHSAACVLSPAGEKSTLMLVQRRWRFGLYAYWIQPENPLQPEQLRSSIETILISPKYKQGAESLQNSIRNTLGPVEAAHRIKNLV
jgi:UDP:flavonoid glycosyltransferase YjiC (YdhE family)